MNRYRIRVQNLDRPELEVTVNLGAVGEKTGQAEALEWCFTMLGWNRVKAWPARPVDPTEALS